MTYSLKTVVHNVTRNKHLVMIDWIAEKNMTAQQRASKLRETKQLISSLDILLVSLSNYVVCRLHFVFRRFKIQSTAPWTIEGSSCKRPVILPRRFFFFSATSKLSHSLGVGPVRRYDSLHFEGETRNHGNRSVMSSSAHSCVRTCRNQRLLPTLLFTYLYLILVVAITVSETEFTVKNARLQLTKNKMALG